MWHLSQPRFPASILWLLVENSFLHDSRSIGFSPVWTRSWVFKLPLSENYFLHYPHSNGFSPVWTRSWVFKRPLVEKRFLHHSH